MLKKNEALVFSTARALREYKKSLFGFDVALNKCYDLGEFFERVIIVNGLKKADTATKLYCLKNAISSVKEAKEALGIPSEFFAFLKCSEYIFSFFKELCLFGVSIEKIELKDTYDNFGEHLRILAKLFKEYEKNLKAKGFYDEISSDYEINDSFIKEFSSIKIFLDGIPSKHEIKVFEKISQLCELKLGFKTTEFNSKLQELITNSFKISLKNGFEYEINASKNEIISEEKLAPKKPESIRVQGFSERSLQCAFVFDEISRMIRAGLKADEIAVILPDESFAQILRNIDENNMLNYAMGKSVRDELAFCVLNAVQNTLKKDTAYHYETKYLEFFKNSYENPADFGAISELLKPLYEHSTNASELENIFSKELFSLEMLSKNLQTLKTKEVLELILDALSKTSVSLSGGGAVTAMGLLESRGAKPKGVIIVDFNDDIVPKRSQKELFLSSKIRARAGLISHKDRENLQKGYYNALINGAKYLSISFTQNEQSVKSRFLKELGLDECELKNDEKNYEIAIAKPERILEFLKPNLRVEHDFFASALSFSRLSTFMKCHELYYYKYILGLKEPRNLGALRDSADFGTTIHGALARYFSEHKDSCDYKLLCFMLDNAFKASSSIDELEFEMLKERLKRFCELQNEHFSKGWRVSACEKELNNEFCGIKIEGKIDRIDINENGELCVIDYKTGSLPKNDLQLQFYKALSGASKGYFIDLKESMDFDEKKASQRAKPVILEDEIQKIKDFFAGRNDGFVCSCGGKEHGYAFKELLKGQL